MVDVGLTVIMVPEGIVTSLYASASVGATVEKIKATSVRAVTRIDMRENLIVLSMESTSC